MTAYEDMKCDAAKRRKVRFSLLHLSFVFFLIYTPYRCLECIQSSLNFEKGLGAMSIGVLQGGNFVSCLIIGAPFVYTFGPKWSMFISFFSHTIFIIANYHPTWITMMPSSIFVGIMSAIIWVSQGTYVTILAQRYAECSTQSIAQILPKFSAVFHLFWGASSPVGNLLASVVLGITRSDDSTLTRQSAINISLGYGESMALTSDNASLDFMLNDRLSYYFENEYTQGMQENRSSTYYSPPVSNTSVCGVNHCPYMSEHLEVLEKPDETLVYMLMSAFLVFNIIGVVTCAFIENVTTPRNSSAKQKLIRTIKLIKKPNLCLMIVPFTLVGMIPGIFYGSFAQSFVSCVFGIGKVGYSLMCEGLGFTVACLICGPLTKIICRQIQFIFVAICLVLISVSWLLWIPSPDQFWIIILMSLLYGLLHGLHRTHLSAMTSYLFPNDPEPAFAHYHLGRTLALCVTFVISPLMCFSAKAYLFLGTVCLGFTTLFILEIKLMRSNERPEVETISANVEKGPIEEPFIHKSKFASILDSQAGSLSGSCTNVNIQA